MLLIHYIVYTVSFDFFLNFSTADDGKLLIFHIMTTESTVSTMPIITVMIRGGTAECCKFVAKVNKKNDRKKRNSLKTGSRHVCHLVSLVLATNLIVFLYSTDVADSKEAT